MAAPTQERLAPVQAPTSEKPAFPSFPVHAPSGAIFLMFVAVSTTVDLLARDKMPRQTLFELSERLLKAVGGEDYDHERAQDTIAHVEMDANEMKMVKKAVDEFPWQVAGRVSRSGDQRQVLINAHGLFQQAFFRTSGLSPEPQAAGVSNLADIKRQAQPQRA